MIVISGSFTKKNLIFRGVCLDNGTCDCEPFYSGTSCGTFNDCPSGLDSTVCSELKTTNLIQSNNLENGTSTNTSGTTTTDNGTTTTDNGTTTTDNGTTTTTGDGTTTTTGDGTTTTTSDGDDKDDDCITVGDGNNLKKINLILSEYTS